MKNTERTRKWTAEKAGIAPTTFTRRLNGKGDFTVGEIARIAKALGVSPHTLLPGEFQQAAA